MYRRGVISYVGGRCGCHLEVAVIICHFMRDEVIVMLIGDGYSRSSSHEG